METNSINHNMKVRGSFFSGFGGASGCLVACLIFATGLFFAARYYFNRKVDEVKASLVYEPPANVKRTQADKSKLTISDINVQVAGAKVDKLEMTNEFTGEKSTSGSPLMLISLYISTNNPTIKYHHRMWGQKELIGQSRVRIADQFGNNYPLLELGGFSQFAFTKTTVAIRSETAATDYLLIEKPVSAAEYLDVDLTDPYFGENAFHFRIPRSMWAGK